MEGIGGASQDVTWQRYNGVRRSKFNPEDDGPYTGGMELERVPSVGGLDKGRRFVGQKAKEDKMWTEITKDLVIEEAIKESGYDFEETEFFYYVMEYLRYVCLPFGLRLSIFLSSFPLRNLLIFRSSFRLY